jgi:hydroxymethylpyrimidine/phosphomethylpyrimidine kinase
MSSLLTLAGMLSSAETIDVIAETLQTHRVPSIVLDPVTRFQRDA